jgi:hypothetical protein
LDEEPKAQRNPYLKDLPPEKSPNAVPQAADGIARLVARLALIPLLFLVVFLAVVAGDSPKAGNLPGLIVLGIGGSIVYLLDLAIRKPIGASKNATLPAKGAGLLVNILVGICAAFGIIFGVMFFLSALVNLSDSHHVRAVPSASNQNH